VLSRGAMSLAELKLFVVLLCDEIIGVLRILFVVSCGAYPLETS
jgi:hypothetical protein